MQNQFLPSETSAEVTPYVIPTLNPAEETEGVTAAEELQTAASTQAVTDLLNRAQHKIHRRRQSYLALFGLWLVAAFCGLTMRLLSNEGSLFMFSLPAFLMMLLIMCIPISLDIPRLEREGGLRAVSTLLDAFNMSSITGTPQERNSRFDDTAAAIKGFRRQPADAKQSSYT